jgi:outer membrane autotransporter protein
LSGNFTDDIKKAQWEIGNFDGGISGYNKSFFSVNATGLEARGRFFVTTEEDSLMLNYKTAAVWLGGSGNWTTLSEWEDDFRPENEDLVEFSGNGGTSTNNYASGNLSEISGIAFTSLATGSYTVNGNALAIGEDGILNDSAFEQTIALNLTGGEVLGVNTATSNLTISGVISGNSALTKTGNKTLTLTGSNTYSGGTIISTGTLALGGTEGSVVGNIDVASGATFAVNRTNQFTLGNTISGAGSFAHTGSNKTSLTAANDYTGGTTISSGTLWVNNPQALGTGSVTLDGGKLLVTSSQEIPMGNQSVSTFRTGSINWNSGVIAFYDRDSSPEANSLTINVGGNFTVSTIGNATFDFSEVAALNFGNYTLVNATLVNADNNKFTAAHGPFTTLFGNFTTTENTVIYSVTGAVSGGSDIQNFGGPNTPVVAEYNVTGPTVTRGLENTVNALNFSNNAPLAIQSNGSLTLTSGTLNVQTGSSVVSGGTLVTPGNFDKTGSGELDLQSNTMVNGIANVVQGLLSVNGQLTTTGGVVVDPGATLGGAGFIVGNVNVNGGNLSPGNSPGTLTFAGNLVLTGANSTIIEIESPTNFDRIVVSGTATLGGTLNAVAYGGGTITPGARYEFLQAGRITGEFDSLIAPEGLRIRFLNSGTIGTLLFGPESFVPFALNQNQRHVAKALDSFVLATEGDAVLVGTALDSLTTEQFPAAFDQIMPGFYESLGDILIEQTYNQTQLLTQRLGTVRVGAQGFQAIGLSQPIKYDKDGTSAADAKTASPIVESAMATNWNAWVMANGEFSISRGLAGVPNYNNNAGGFLVGADYRLSENFAAGLFAGYEYSYAKYDGGSSTRGNSALFGLYGSYTHEDGYYADAIVSGGYTGFQTRRSIEFGTIDRTASADPNSGQFSAALNLGKDFEIGKFTLGPIIGAQYTYAGIGGFTETGAESLDLALGQQNANSLRTNLGARLAYNWEVASNITLIPEVRGFWMHEFLNNPRNISSTLDGGNGPSFDYETTAPYRDSVFGGAGISAKIGDRWSGSVFYNVNFGAEGYTNNIISTSLGFSF